MKVSIVIPCYNVSNFINKSFDSILNQTISDYEIIFINDGSTDDTEIVLNNIIKSNPECKISIIDSPHKGASSARNLGIKQAKGKYIQFLDADDILLDNKLDSQIKLMENHDAKFIVGSYKWINDQDNLISESVIPISQNIQNHFISLAKTKLGITSANLYHKDLFISTVSWNENFTSSQDFKLTFDLLKKGIVYVIDENINTIKVERPNSITGVNRKLNHKNFLKVVVEMRDFLIETKCDKLHVDELNQIIFHRIKMIANYDINEAVKEFSINLPKDFTPTISQYSSGLYNKVLKFLGFKNTEYLRKLIS